MRTSINCESSIKAGAKLRMDEYQTENKEHQNKKHQLKEGTFPNHQLELHHEQAEEASCHFKRFQQSHSLKRWFSVCEPSTRGCSR